MEGQCVEFEELPDVFIVEDQGFDGLNFNFKMWELEYDTQEKEKNKNKEEEKIALMKKKQEDMRSALQKLKAQKRQRATEEKFKKDEEKSRKLEIKLQREIEKAHKHEEERKSKEKKKLLKDEESSWKRQEKERVEEERRVLLERARERQKRVQEIENEAKEKREEQMQEFQKIDEFIGEIEQDVHVFRQKNNEEEREKTEAEEMKRREEEEELQIIFAECRDIEVKAYAKDVWSDKIKEKKKVIQKREEKLEKKKVKNKELREDSKNKLKLANNKLQEENRRLKRKIRQMEKERKSVNWRGGRKRNSVVIESDSDGSQTGAIEEINLDSEEESKDMEEKVESGCSTPPPLCSKPISRSKPLVLPKYLDKQGNEVSRNCYFREKSKKTYICPHCEKVLKRSDTLKNHVENLHKLHIT